MKITSKQLREKWLNFYKARGHVDIGAVSLIGDGSTGVMFNVAGMQPLMPYLLGAKHPSGKTRLCNVQGCVRTIDIDEVGDESHFTFFEMMGNWSLGDYFKKEKTAWSFEFLIKELGFDPNKICSTVFAGNDVVARDDEAVECLVNAGVKRENIYFLKDNWWDLPGTVNTPCGPDNEWFYPRYDKPCEKGDKCDVTCECGRWVEIGNDVYMQYKKLPDGSVTPLKNKNVDTGFGFERLLMYVNGFTDGYKTDLFTEVLAFLESQIGAKYGEHQETTKSMRIIVDHMRTAVMLIGDEKGILPSNVGAGYILRRLLRRAIRHAKKINLDPDKLLDVAKIYIEKVYEDSYPLLVEKEEYILSSIKAEVDKFLKTIETGNKEFDKLVSGLQRKVEFMKKNNPEYKETEADKTISGKSAFRLYETYGFPIEMTIEMAKELGYSVDEKGYEVALKEHQDLAKASAEKAKSGLASTGEIETKYHTATHLLNAALKQVVGETSHQMGSNINAERLRFDFACDHKLSDEEIKSTEDLVNSWIKADFTVTREEMKKEDAVKAGAEHQFIERYPAVVSVYTIGNVSKEICTGPHVEHTGVLGHFRIKKEEASSSGVRRIKAVLEDK